MKRIGAFEARTHLGELLAEVAQGEVVQITYRGEPIAELRPVQKPEDPAEAMRWLLSSTVKLRGLSIRELIQEGRR